MNTPNRTHPMALLPFIILLAMIVWQLISYNYYSGLPQPNQILFMAFSIIFAIAALFYRNANGELKNYLERVISPFRKHMIAISCILIGGVHFISALGDESVFVQMGFMILILAFYETSSMAIDFYPHYSNGMIETTKGTVQRLLANQAGRLGMVFALSVIMLYLSLMVIVGFTGPFSVAFLAALMILAIAFMTMVRRL